MAVRYNPAFDFQLPERFELEYTGSHLARSTRPIMIHRVSVFGKHRKIYRYSLRSILPGLIQPGLHLFRLKMLPIADRHLDRIL